MACRQHLTAWQARLLLLAALALRCKGLQQVRRHEYPTCLLRTHVRALTKCRETSGQSNGSDSPHRRRVAHCCVLLVASNGRENWTRPCTRDQVHVPPPKVPLPVGRSGIGDAKKAYTQSDSTRGSIDLTARLMLKLTLRGAASDREENPRSTISAVCQQRCETVHTFKRPLKTLFAAR